MHSTLKQKQTDDPHDFVVVAPDAVRVAPADEELSKLLHEAAARYRADPQTSAGSVYPAGTMVPPVDARFRPAAVNDVLASGNRWSMGRGAVRAFTALLLASCIGVAAVAWQSKGDVAKQLLTKWMPKFVLTTSMPPAEPGPAAQAAVLANQSDAANAAPAPAPPAPSAQSAVETVAPTAAALPSDSAQLLQSMARDLASAEQEIEQLKASVEQLKASQQQMSRDVARVSEAKASEQNVRPRTSGPPRSAAAPARRPPPQAAAVRPLPQAAAPQAVAPYAPPQPEPQPQTTAPPQADPELTSVPRPPMPVR